MKSEGMKIGRRGVLAGGALALGGAGAYALTRESGGESPVQEEGAPTEVEDERAASLAARFAPDLHFDARERWFATDPLRYASDRDGDRVVDGFDALDGYTAEFGDDPPAPTVYYRVVEYPDDPLVVVQYWIYSAFDQFTTNFHWHDWELLQTFVDTDADRAVCHAASAHSRAVPNNEYLEPEAARAAVLSELGSHSSALGLNATRDRFERLPLDDSGADVTNEVLTAAGVVEALPAAYGLPRDEGFRLPYLVPELDGEPLTAHDRLPNVDASDLLPDDVTMRRRDALDAPPTDLPAREPGEVWTHPDSPTEGDRTYGLVSTAEVREIDALTGPTLSFEFPIPGFAEDAVASHLSPTDLPWTQPRWTRPEVDVTDPAHRSALADRYDGVTVGGALSRIVGAVRETRESADAPDGEGVATLAPTVEATALLESDPTPVPTSAGRVIADVPPGDHRLTLDAAGTAPYAEQVPTGEGETVRAGVDGALSVVPNAAAVKVRLETAAEAGVERVAIEDDFAGRLYDAPPDGEGRAAVYAHEGGAYTVEVRDAEGVPGAYRANPDPGEGVTLQDVQTGKVPLAGFVRDLLSETLSKTEAATETTQRAEPDLLAQRTETGDSDDSTATPTATPTPTATSEPTERGTGGGQNDSDSGGGVVNGLSNALDAAERAAARAAERDGPGADKQLEAVRNRLDGLEQAVDSAPLSPEFRTLLRRRLSILDRRIAEALDAPA
jgi:hypothetical protein